MALEPPSNWRQDRYQELLDLGFSKDWIDAVTRHQPSLYENPRVKIEGLRQRGFDNPVKLIEGLS